MVLLVWWLSRRGHLRCLFRHGAGGLRHWFGRSCSSASPGRWCTTRWAASAISSGTPGRGFDLPVGRAMARAKIIAGRLIVVTILLWIIGYGSDAMSMRRLRSAGCAAWAPPSPAPNTGGCSASRPLPTFRWSSSWSVFVIRHLGATRAEIVASIANPFVAILLALTFVSAALAHAAWPAGGDRGLCPRPRAPSSRPCLLNTFFTVVLGVAALYAILKMSFGL